MRYSFKLGPTIPKCIVVLAGSVLGYPSTCEIRGVIHSCTLSLACWLVGGTLTAGCGGDILADWLFTCCVTAHSPRPQPMRRWGLQNSQVGKHSNSINMFFNRFRFEGFLLDPWTKL